LRLLSTVEIPIVRCRSFLHAFLAPPRSSYRLHLSFSREWSLGTKTASVLEEDVGFFGAHLAEDDDIFGITLEVVISQIMFQQGLRDGEINGKAYPGSFVLKVVIF
jgi:hypothetical protein